MSSYFYKIKRKLGQELWQIQHGNKPKVFGIGRNKTGTTSLKSAMSNLGYKIGNQRTAERLTAPFWSKRNFKPIVKYCKSAEFFQDTPFSKPYTFIALDQAFPGSKFILTIRHNPEQWYASVTRYHAKLWGKKGRIPTKEDLMDAPYIYKGWAWEMNRLSNLTPENDPYNKDILINAYELYNNQVLDYFRHRPEDLLVLNVSQPRAYGKLCEFLGVESL